MEFTLTEYGGQRVVTATVSVGPGTLRLAFDASAIEGLTWPEKKTANRADGLWKHTCFELFIREAGRPEYHELNLSPSGAWNCYRFDGYRTGMTTSCAYALEEVTSTGQRINAVFKADFLPGRLRLAPCMVATSAAGTAYFAPAHGNRPDFHDPARHVLAALDDL